MFLKSITIKNFKSFINETIELCVPDGENIGSGLNIFVGENNSGKSTAFEAIDFLRNGLPSGKGIADLKNKNAQEDDEMFVEILFRGRISNLIDLFSDKKFQSYIFEENNQQYLKVRRSSKVHEITQNGKKVEITIKKIGIWNSEAGQFENPSGFDAAFTKLFEVDFIWADTNPEDIVNFGSTKICGKLLKSITQSFFTGSQWVKFQEEHKKTFHVGEESLKAKVKEIELRTHQIFTEQFGSAKIEFDFQLPDEDSFFKGTKIRIHDGIETEMGDKGGGMQRAVALALLQVYAENLVKHSENQIVQKPFYLFIDEPEICLHPQAQKKLLSALKVLTQKKQIFLTSHSPYFIDPDLIGNICRFENTDKTEGVKTFICNSTATISKLKEKVNRVFFFHHRDLFFAKQAIFLEGADDYERYSLFCENNGLEKTIQTLSFLAGKDDWRHFKSLCEALKITTRFVFDLDVLFKNNQTISDENIKLKIQKLGKVVKPNPEKLGKAHPDKKQRCEPLFDEQLIDEEKRQKNEILEDLKKQNIFVLHLGMLENYLDKNGEMIKDGNEDQKEAELKAIFNL